MKFTPTPCSKCFIIQLTMWTAGMYTTNSVISYHCYYYWQHVSSTTLECCNQWLANPNCDWALNHDISTLPFEVYRLDLKDRNLIWDLIWNIFKLRHYCKCMHWWSIFARCILMPKDCRFSLRFAHHWLKYTKTYKSEKCSYILKPFSHTMAYS